MVSLKKRYLLTFFIRIYEHIWGNCTKKDLDFKEVIENTWGHKKLADLLKLVDSNELN